MADGDEIPNFRLNVIQLFPALGGGIVVLLKSDDIEFKQGDGAFHVVNDKISHVDKAKMGFGIKKVRSGRRWLGTRRTGARVEPLHRVEMDTIP